MTGEQLRQAVAGIDWWHTIDLGQGIVTPGRGGSPQLLARMRMPPDLTGQTVLDLGTFDGFFAFEAERRGAMRVVALDHRHPAGFALAHHVLESRVEFALGDVMRLSPRDPGVFDVVFFMGLLYHLPNPMAALERVSAVTKHLLILETDGAFDWIAEPAARLVGDRAALSDSSRNWWLPNVPCLTRMVEAVGFERVEVVFGPRAAPRSLAGKVVRRLFRKRLAPRSSRIVIHAWKRAESATDGVGGISRPHERISSS